MAKSPAYLCWLVLIGWFLVSGCVVPTGNQPGDEAPLVSPAGNSANGDREVIPSPSRSPEAALDQPTPTLGANATPELVPRPAATSPKLLRTPLNTPTLPPLEAEPQPALTVVPANPDEVAMAAQSLIYLQDGSLWWWDYRSQQAVLLDDLLKTSAAGNDANGNQPTGRIVDFLLHPAGDQVILQRATGVTANGEALYAVELGDLSTPDSRVLLEDAAQLFDWQLSPEGAWLTYRTKAEGGSLQVLPLQANQTIQLAELCAPEAGNQCQGLIWSPDEKQLAWGDSQGLWLAEPGEFDPRQILTGALEVEDQSGEQITIGVVYAPLSWSPYPRYLLVSVRQPRRAEVGWVGLVDLRVGRIVEVPGTYQYRSPGGKTSWDSDGNLVVLRADQPNQLFLETWKITPTRQDLLLLQGRLEIDLAATLAGQGFDLTAANFLPGSLQRLDARRMALTVVDENNRASPRLLVVDTKIRQVVWVGLIPYDTRAISWSENQAGFLVEGAHGAVLYQAIDDKPMSNLATLLGEGVEMIAWLPVNSVPITETELD